MNGDSSDSQSGKADCLLLAEAGRAKETFYIEDITISCNIKSDVMYGRFGLGAILVHLLSMTLLARDGMTFETSKYRG